MLYIQNYTKFDLDKSSQSMYRYYTGLLEDLNNDINDIREYLVNMLNEIAGLRTALQQVKSDLQKSLDDTKDAYSSHGYSNSALDTVQKLLDEAESNLDDLESKVVSAIESLDCNEGLPADCEQVCTFTADCAESEYDCQDQVNPIQQNCDDHEIPESCLHCSYAVNPCADTLHTKTCEVCSLDDCTVNLRCSESTGDGAVINCNYTYVENIGCNEQLQIEYNESCGEREVTCTYGGGSSEYIHDGCLFSCEYSSDCGNVSPPSNCTYTDECNHSFDFDETCKQIILGDCDYSYCDYDSSDCIYTNFVTGEASCPGNDDNNHYYFNDEDENGCRYDSETGYSDNCTNFCDYNPDDPDHSNPDCGDSGCSYDPVEDGVDCEAGDNYDPTCDELSDDDGGDDDSNVICTYIINRLHLGKEYLSISADNLKIGFRNGITKDILREYMYGLGPEIIDHLTQESDEDIEALWENTIKPIWVELRLHPNYGVKAYIEFVKSLCVTYNVDYKKYPHLSPL